MKNLGLIFLSSFVFFTTSAQATEFGILGGINFFNPSLESEPGDASVTTSSTAGFVGGFSYKSSLALINVEIDALYDKKKLSSGTIDSTSNWLEIPVLARYVFFPFFNFGLGAYYSVGLGDVSVAGVTENYQSAGMNRSDFGLLGSIQMELPIAPQMTLIADLRYNYGLVELEENTAAASEKSRELQVMFGVSYEL
jgi:hypothetical protein